MKKKKIIVLSLLALLLIPKDTVYAGESDEVFETVIEPTEIRFVDGKKLENLDSDVEGVDTVDDLIQEIYKAAVARKKTVSVRYHGSWEDIPDGDELYENIIKIDDKSTSDDADYLYGNLMSFGYNIKTDGDDSIVRFRFSNLESAAQLKKVNAASKKILKKLKVSKMSDVAKVKVIHDYVINLVQYDRTKTDHSAYGGLVAGKHTTVCQGYTLIMYKLLTDAGLDAHYVRGTGDTGIGHAWNTVKIKNKWYFLDATWDDRRNSIGYDYFLVGKKTIKKDHVLSKEFEKQEKYSPGNLNWKSALSKSKSQWDKEAKKEQKQEEKKKAKQAKARANFARKIEKSLDELSADASPELSELYDLRKEIYGFVINDISSKAFSLLKKGDYQMNLALVNGTELLLNDYIIDPTLEYLSSEEYAVEAENQVRADFPDMDFDSMSDDRLKKILAPYLNEAFEKKLGELSKKYTKSIVKSVVKRLNSLV